MGGGKGGKKEGRMNQFQSQDQMADLRKRTAAKRKGEKLTGPRPVKGKKQKGNCLGV